MIQVERRNICIDLIKVLAAFLVILLHTASMLAYDIKGAAWKEVVLLDALTRTAVPLFVMCSGAMLLGKMESYKEFFKKRFFKVVIPLMSWSLFYEWHLINNGIEKTIVDIVKDFFSNNTMYHLWFLYMMLSLYLVTPVLRKLVCNLTKKDYYYILIVWLIFSLTNTIGDMWGFVKTPLLTFFNEYICYFFIAYFFIAYFLFNIEKYSSKIVYTAWALLFLGHIAAMLGTYYVSIKTGKYNSSFIANGSFPITLATLSIFILFSAYSKKIEEMLGNMISALVIETSKLTFGIYLAHIYVLSKTYHYLYQSNFYKSQHPILAIFLVTVIVFFLSGLITYVLKKIPVIRHAV